MTSEVFVPANGNLAIRGNLSDGLGVSTDTFRKGKTAGMERPATQGSGSRFGSLSHNSFFARHNPHPGRVRHIKGLLDIPICAVNDQGYFSNPRYSLQFPPNNFNDQKVKNAKLPVNAINVNSQMHPINTITGLQWFMGKPLNHRIFREKAIPKVGLVPETDAWRDELRALTEAIGIIPKEEKKRPAEEKPRTAQYSADTGRLIPPPSRAMSRGYSRASRREQMFNQFQHIAEGPDVESMILQMLCQILQTDDVNAVQAWLVSAADREKNLVMDMIRSALSSSEEYYKTNPNGQFIDERPKSVPHDYVAPPVPEEEPSGQLPAGEETLMHKIDRLTLEPSSPRPASVYSKKGAGQQEAPAAPKEEGKPVIRYSFTPSHGDPKRLGTPTRMATPKHDEQLDINRRPVTSDAFRPNKSRGGPRPGTGQARVGSANKQSNSYNLSSEARLRYVTTPVANQNISSQKRSLNDVLNGRENSATWNPEMSTLAR